MDSINALVNACILYKNAALIKVPEPLLAELQANAVGLYCKSLSKALQSALNFAIATEHKKEFWQNEIPNMKETYEYLQGFVNEDITVGQLFGTVGYNHQVELVIPFFDDVVNMVLHSRGTLSSKTSMLDMKLIYDNSNKLYTLTVKYEGGQDKGITGNAKTIRQTLKKRIGSIRQYLYAFIDFLGKYEVPFSGNFSFLRELIIISNSKITTTIKENDEPYFVIDLKSMPYFQSISGWSKIKHALVGLSFAASKQAASIIYDKEEWSGLCKEIGLPSIVEAKKPVFHIGNIFVSRDIRNDVIQLTDANMHLNGVMPIFEDYINDIRQTIKHESSHLIQSFIKFALGPQKLNETTKQISNRIPAGIPGKNMREPGYNPYGFPSTQNMFGRLNHSIRDIEFYTDLGDNIALFKNSVRKMPKELQTWYMNIWINKINYPEGLSADWIDNTVKNKTGKELNDNQFAAIHDAIDKLSYGHQLFKQFKQINFEKYKKAVIEFYKAIHM